MNGTLHTAILIAVAAVVTLALRALPFVLFGGKRKMPGWIKKISDVLPPAIMGVLIVYCMKESIAAPGADLVFQLIAAAVVVAMHLWRKNTLISIFSGTAVYMLLISIF